MTTTERSGESAIGGKERTDAVWRDVHDGRVWRAQACRIVEESPELIALWMPRGSSTCSKDDAGERAPHPDRRVGARAGRRWTRDAASCVARPGRAHSVYVFWGDEGTLSHWYVNFEQPLRRTPVGFDTFDEKLDLIVMPDGTYRWKDEDELEQAAAAGLLDARRGPGRGSARARGVAVPDRLGGLAA